MKGRFLLLPIGFAAFFISGCGGLTSVISNPFAGTWSGTLTIPTVSQSGTIAITIDSQGASNGTQVNTTLGDHDTLTGFIGTDGTIVWTIAGAQSGTLTGTVSISTSNGHLIGAVTQTIGSSAQTLNLDLTIQ